MRVVVVALLVLFLAAPVSANFVAYGPDQAGVKVLGTSYLVGAHAVFVMVKASLSNGEQVRLRVVPPGGTGFNPDVCEGAVVTGVQRCTVSGIVPPGWSYQIVLTGGTVNTWYEMEDIMLPIEVALAGLWVLSFIGGVLVGRW